MIDKKRQVAYYEDLLSTYGDHFLSLDWKSPESQEIRFRIFSDLINMFEHDKISVLDVGCGFGDLFGYLEKNGFKISYTGYDIAPKILETAKKKYPKANFELKDILHDPNPKKADFVFCCGTLNIAFDDRATHLEFIRSMLLRMFELCNIAVGVNFLSSQAIYHLRDEELEHPQYFYTKVEEIISWMKGMAGRWVIRHDYHPGDFTVYLIK